MSSNAHHSTMQHAIQHEYTAQALYSLTYGTMPASRLRGLVCRNTYSRAVQSPTESGLLSCPILGAVRLFGGAGLVGFGQGAPVRKAGGATLLALRTPCPPFACNARNGGFSSPPRKPKTMTQTTFTPAPVLNDIIEKYTRQVKAPNGIPHQVFMPLVQAILDKEEEGSRAHARRVKHQAETQAFALPNDPSAEAPMRKVSDLEPLPYAWAGLAGASLMLEARQAILHNAAAGFDPAEFTLHLLDDAKRVRSQKGAVAEGLHGAAVQIESAIAELATAMLMTEQGLDILRTMFDDARKAAKEDAIWHENELMSKAMLMQELREWGEV